MRAEAAARQLGQLPLEHALKLSGRALLGLDILRLSLAPSSDAVGVQRSGAADLVALDIFLHT